MGQVQGGQPERSTNRCRLRPQKNCQTRAWESVFQKTECRLQPAVLRRAPISIPAAAGVREPCAPGSLPQVRSEARKRELQFGLQGLLSGQKPWLRWDQAQLLVQAQPVEALPELD